MAELSEDSSSFHSTVLQSLETIQVSLNNLQINQETCASRIDRLERKAALNPTFESESTTVQEIPKDSGRVGIGSGPSPSRADKSGTEFANFQREFENIRDSLTKTKLPNNLKLLESKTGIKREDQSMYNSVSKSARYTETCLKLLANFDEDVSATDLGQLYIVLVAHMNFLQSEYTSLIVKGQFDRETATLFKCLEKHTSTFKGESLDNLKTAAEIAAVRGRTTRKDNYRSRPFNRGRGRGYMGFPRGRQDTSSNLIPSDRDELQ